MGVRSKDKRKVRDNFSVPDISNWVNNRTIGQDGKDPLVKDMFQKQNQKMHFGHLEFDISKMETARKELES